MEDQDAFSKYISELRKGPTDIWALLGTVLSVFGFLALVGYKPNSSGLSFLVGIYSAFFEGPWIWLSKFIGFDLGDMSVDFLAWFTVLLGLHIRGVRMGFYRIRIHPYHEQVDWGLFCFAMLAPLFMVLDGVSDTNIWFWIVFFLLYAITGRLLYGLQRKTLKHFKISKAADEIATGWTPFFIGVSIYIFAVAVVGNMVWKFEANTLAEIGSVAPGLTGIIAEVIVFILFLFAFVPTVVWLTTFALAFNAYLLVSVPRIFSSTVLLLIVTIIGDQVIGSSMNSV